MTLPSSGEQLADEFRVLPDRQKEQKTSYVAMCVSVKDDIIALREWVSSDAYWQGGVGTEYGDGSSTC